MKPMVDARTRLLTVVAQDPSVRTADGEILTAQVEVPVEDLAPGPRGHRVHVVDYDATADTQYRPREADLDRDPFDGAASSRLLASPDFHAQNVYALVMRTLARFEHALGRRVSWAFDSHQILVSPHAFADANAFYSRRDNALMFGYFEGRSSEPGERVFSCLSHDVVVHEATHALLDGLRERFSDPSSPDQAAFHEAFADVVAILSVFALRPVVELLLDLGDPPKAGQRGLVAKARLTREALRESVLLGLAEQMGQEMAGVRGKALRRSATLDPARDLLKRPEFQEPHRRGEVLVAAVLHAFLDVWTRRLEALGELAPGKLDRERVAEEGAGAADYLLTMAIRALDYAPPIDVTFGDYLSALLTADLEIRPDDSRYRFRDALRASCRAFGIDPEGEGGAEPGAWPRAVQIPRSDRTHFEPMQRDPDEVFRFLWESRKLLALDEEAFTRVLSVRPVLRIAPDGFFLRETVAEYVQLVDLPARELERRKIEKPPGMSPEQRVRLQGAGALVFDEYGALKYHVVNAVGDRALQQARIAHLWRSGYYRERREARRFATLHRAAIWPLARRGDGEEW